MATDGSGDSLLPNGRLLLDYGFCIADHPNDEVALPLPPPAPHEMSKPRLAALSRLRLLDMPPPRLTGGGTALPSELAVFARLLTVQPAEKAMAEAAAASRDFEAYARHAEQLESVRRYVRSLVLARLAEYPTSAAQDDVLLAELPSTGKEHERRRCAILLRRAEKRLLERWLLLLDDERGRVAEADGQAPGQPQRSPMKGELR